MQTPTDAGALAAPSTSASDVAQTHAGVGGEEGRTRARARNRDPNRAFSLSESDITEDDTDGAHGSGDEDDDDDDVATMNGSEMLTLDGAVAVDGVDHHGNEVDKGHDEQEGRLESRCHGGTEGGDGGDGNENTRTSQSAVGGDDDAGAHAGGDSRTGEGSGNDQDTADTVEGNNSSSGGSGGRGRTEQRAKYPGDSSRSPSPASKTGGDRSGLAEAKDAQGRPVDAKDASGSGQETSPVVPGNQTGTKTSTLLSSSSTSKAVSAAALAVASSGPGAVARAERWSDRELMSGLMQPEDFPVVAAHDVSRSVGGIEVKRGLLVVCRNTVYFISGFGREPALPKPGAPPPSPAVAAAAAAAAAAASRSKDPLHGVRRLEEWELGGGAGGIGGADDDGEMVGAKIQVKLRRRSATEVAAGDSSGGDLNGKSGGGSGARGGGGRGGRDGSARGSAQMSASALTAEQAGGDGSGGACRETEDEILALGRRGVQRFSLDQVKRVYCRARKP